jgi:hypothetical protein
MLFKLSHKQREALCAAADRADRLFPSPPHLKVGEAKKLAAKLVAVGAGQGVKAKPGAPIWRRDATGQACALRLTAAGVNAVAADVKNQSETVGVAAATQSETAVPPKSDFET